MADSYIDLTLNENDIKLKVEDNGDGTYSLSITDTGGVVTGTVGIDQVTAKANEVVIKSITAGSTIIGAVGIDQATANANEAVIKSILAGETHIGSFSSHGKTISLTPTITAGAYSANDAVGGILEFEDAARVSGAGGVIKQLLLIDDAGQDATLQLWLFNQTFTAMVDNAAWAPSVADLENLIAIVYSTDGTWSAAGTPSANIIPIANRYDLVGTSLFGQLVTTGIPTYTGTGNLTVKIGILQD